MNYRVTSSNFVIGEEGTTLTDEQLEGCGIDALIVAGHLAPETAKSSKASDPAPEPETEGK